MNGRAWLKVGVLESKRRRAKGCEVCLQMSVVSQIKSHLRETFLLNEMQQYKEIRLKSGIRLH